VQVACLAAHRIDCAFDEPERVFKTPDKLGRDDIRFERLLGFGDFFGQIENEVPFADPLGEVDQFADELFHRVVSLWR
jgi:hypothetical protein